MLNPKSPHTAVGVWGRIMALVDDLVDAENLEPDEGRALRRLASLQHDELRVIYVGAMCGRPACDAESQRRRPSSSRCCCSRCCTCCGSWCRCYCRSNHTSLESRLLALLLHMAQALHVPSPARAHGLLRRELPPRFVGSARRLLESISEQEVAAKEREKWKKKWGLESSEESSSGEEEEESGDDDVDGGKGGGGRSSSSSSG